MYYLDNSIYDEPKSKKIQPEFFFWIQKLEIFFFYVGTSKILDPVAKRLHAAVKVGQLFVTRHSCDTLVSSCILLDFIKTALNSSPTAQSPIYL